MTGSTSVPPVTGIEADPSGLYVLDQGPNQRGRVRFLNLTGSAVVLAGIPRQLLRTELLWETAAGFYAGPTAEWSPDRYPVDLANTLYADDYAIWGFKAGWQPKRGRNAGLSLFIEARNLSNTTYAATTGVIADARGRDSAQFLPGDGRSVYAGVDYRF